MDLPVSTSKQKNIAILYTLDSSRLHQKCILIMILMHAGKTFTTTELLTAETDPRPAPATDDWLSSSIHEHTSSFVMLHKIITQRDNNLVMHLLLMEQIQGPIFKQTSAVSPVHITTFTCQQLSVQSFESFLFIIGISPQYHPYILPTMIHVPWEDFTCITRHDWM